MYLEIVTPEATLFKGDVDSVAVPGVLGEFEMLKDHAPIVSLLKAGHVKIFGNIEIEEEFETDHSGRPQTIINWTAGARWMQKCMCVKKGTS